MSIGNALEHPIGDEDFEALCHELYRSIWKDSSCRRVGRKGQPQYGVDILGNDGKQAVGIQCKHYAKKGFTLATITRDIEKAEKAQLQIGHLLFATTALSNSTLVKKVHDLSQRRAKNGQFTVSVDFWGEISGHVRLYPEIGRAYIPNFPGAPILEVKATTETHFELYQEDRKRDTAFQSQSLEDFAQLRRKVDFLVERSTAPDARGDEADPRVVTTLDLIRDCIREGKSKDAELLLGGLGDPQTFRDQFSRFRWHTDQAFVHLFSGRKIEAASEFLTAFELARDNEKAHINRAQAFLLKDQPSEGLKACNESLERFPDCAPLWGLRLHAKRVLGEKDLEADLPPHLSDHKDLLYARAGVRALAGDNEGSLALLKQHLQIDGESLDVKRAYLASALSCVAAAPVAAHFGQIALAKREALEDAVRRLEVLENTIPTLQSDLVSLELTNNTVVALSLLGQKDRAYALASIALPRHPLSEGLLQTKIRHLDEHDDMEAIRKLTNPLLQELPIPILGLLAEVSANHGEVGWHATVMQTVEASSMVQERKIELAILSSQALWVSGDREGAIASARAYIEKHPDRILARVVLGNMLARTGDKAKAIQEASACSKLTSPKSPPLQRLQVGDLLFYLKQFREAVPHYDSLIEQPGADEITRKFLGCLIETDQRRRAQELLEGLPKEVREASSFRRLEAQLASRRGDWTRMRDLLAQEVDLAPRDLRTVLPYLGALFRTGDREQLVSYLSKDPRFADSRIEDEFEFAKFQSTFGFDDLAVLRVFRFFRGQPSNARNASFFLTQLLISRKTTLLANPVEARPGTVVHLKGAADTRVVAIDLEDEPVPNSWPELVPATGDVAKLLIGLRVGDKVKLPRAFGDHECEVIELQSVTTFAAAKAHAQLAAAVVPAGPLWTARIVREDGKPDIEMLLASAKERAEHVQKAFNDYREHRFPITLLARAIGTDPVTLVLEWPHAEAPYFVGLGTHEEREESIRLVSALSGKRVVVDLVTLTELVQRDIFDIFTKMLGRPLVSQTLREHLLAIAESIKSAQPTGTMGTHDGKLQLIEIPPSYYARRQGFLDQLLHAVERSCDVVPTTGPKIVTETHQALSESLDPDSLDALYLCLEHGAILLSEDGGLRLVAAAADVRTTVGIQPVLLAACARGLITEERYARLLYEKLASGHDFISVRAEDMFLLARKEFHRLTEPVRIMLETFRKPTLELISGLRVCATFLARCFQFLPVKIAIRYGNLVVEVLEQSRPEHAAAVRRVLSSAIATGLRNRQERLKPVERQAIQSLLSSLASELS